MALAALDRSEVDRFARTFEELFDRGEVATMASFYARDAIVMAPDTEPVSGRHAIEAFFREASDASRRTGFTRKIQIQGVECSADLGYVLSTVVLEFRSVATTSSALTFHDVTVWRREADERWRIVVDSATRTTPLPVPARDTGGRS